MVVVAAAAAAAGEGGASEELEEAVVPDWIEFSQCPVCKCEVFIEREHGCDGCEIRERRGEDRGTSDHADNDGEENSGVVAVHYGRSIPYRCLLGNSLRRSLGCRIRWVRWVLARLSRSASTRKSEVAGKRGESTKGPTLILCCKLSESNNAASSMSSWRGERSASTDVSQGSGSLTSDMGREWMGEGIVMTIVSIMAVAIVVVGGGVNK